MVTKKVKCSNSKTCPVGMELLYEWCRWTREYREKSTKKNHKELLEAMNKYFEHKATCKGELINIEEV